MKTKLTLSLFALLLFIQNSFAGATEDLWTALKGAKYPDALAAIAAGADVKSLDPNFGTPLNFASCWADASVVKALIDAKSEINFVAASNGNTPLINAAAWGNVEAIKLLLAAGADLKIKTKLGQSLLSQAVTSDNIVVVKLLVDAGADPKEKYTIGALKDQSLLNALVSTKDPNEKVEFIATLQKTLGSLGVTFPDKLKNTKESDLSPLGDITKYLLEKGLDPNQPVPGWGDITNYAIDFGKIDIAKALIEGGVKYDPKAEMKVKDKYSANKSPEIVTFPNIVYTNGDYLLVAVLSNSFDFVKFMAEKNPKALKKIYEGNGKMGCSENGRDLAPYSVEDVDLLMIAAEHGNPEIVKFLIDKGLKRGNVAKVKMGGAYNKASVCKISFDLFTHGFAKRSGKQEIIDLIKTADK